MKVVEEKMHDIENVPIYPSVLKLQENIPEITFLDLLLTLKNLIGCGILMNENTIY
jgi:hypothetical protein